MSTFGKRTQSPNQTPQRHAPEEDPEREWIKQRKATWAALIKLIYESDPLLCPKCHTQMKIISVIKDGAVIDKILHHLQYKFEVLPLSARPPPPQYFSCDSDFPWIRLPGLKAIDCLHLFSPWFYHDRCILFLPAHEPLLSVLPIGRRYSHNFHTAV